MLQLHHEMASKGRTQSTTPSKNKLNRVFSINGQNILTDQSDCINIEKAKIDEDPMIIAERLVTQFTDLDTKEINTILRSHVPNEINKRCIEIETFFLPVLEKAAVKESGLISRKEGICDDIETVETASDDVGDDIVGMKSHAFYKRLDKFVCDLRFDRKPPVEVYKRLERLLQIIINIGSTHQVEHVERGIYHQLWIGFIRSILTMVTEGCTGSVDKSADARSVYNHNCIPHILQYTMICSKVNCL